MAQLLILRAMCSNVEEVLKTTEVHIDMTTEADDDETQAAPSTKEFLTTLFSKSPNDSV